MEFLAAGVYIRFALETQARRASGKGVDTPTHLRSEEPRRRDPDPACVLLEPIASNQTREVATV